MKKDDLTKHIELVNSKGGHYKTVLYTSNIYYLIVTKVNFLTVKLWVDYINELIKNNPTTPKTEPINKINWLIMVKSYRRDFENNLINKINVIS